jgi:DNA polymerase-1
MTGRGPKDADLLIVGQNPGYKDDRVGEPFVGEAGTLINRLLREIDPSIKVRITNAVKCYTPDNRKPTLAEQEACRSYLVQEIVDSRPIAIMALGNEALVSLTGQGGVSKKRNVPTKLRAAILGQLLNSDSFGPTELPSVLATWHPAFILRDRSHYHELEESFAAIVRYIRDKRGDEQGQTVRWAEWSNLHEIEELIAETSSNGSPVVIGYDIETNALPFRDPKFETLMLGFSNGERAYVVRRAGHIAFVAARLWELAQEGRIKLVGYNSVSFDDVATDLRSYDTLYLDYICDEGVSSYDGRQKGRHKLQSSVVRHLQIPPWKDEVTWKWEEFDVFSHLWDTAALYNARDAVYTTRDYNVLWNKLTDKQKLLVEHIMQPAGRFLAKIEERGVPISLKNLDAVKLEVEIAREKALDTLVRKAFEYDLWTFNPNSHPQVRELLFDKMRLKPVNYTGGGEPSTDEETLRALVLVTTDEASLKAVNSLLAYRKENKLLSTYINKCQPEASGRIHSSYSLTQTVTGRTTSYGWSPQRMPRDKRLRKIVCAPPGMKLISADLSQIEMRTMAFLSREPNMLAVYRDGKYGGDMHNFIATAMVKAMYGREEFVKEERDLAKRVGFGCLYGAEWFTLQATMLSDFGIKLSAKECQFLRDDVFFAALPGLPEYYNSVIRRAQKTGVVEGTFGLKRQLPNINSRDLSLRTAAAREAINTDNQGLASYLALIGCAILEEVAPPDLLQQFAFIHDATLALATPANVDEAAELIRFVFETEVQEYVRTKLGVDFDVPIKIDIKIGESWGEL